MKNYRTARKRVTVSVGESVRIIRELGGALKCHPGVLVFPGWVVATKAAA